MAFTSLKSKMSVSISLVVVMLAALLAFSLFDHFQSHVKKSVAEYQLVLVRKTAAEIDDKILQSQKALLSVANGLPRRILKNSNDAQTFLDIRYGTHSIFDNGLFLFSPEGKIIAESPFLPGRRGKDFSFREYFRQTIATRRPFISDPYPSTHNNGKPAIILTVPLFDQRGKLEGILAGGLDLTKENFLGKLSRVRMGRTGYMFLFSNDGIVIIHPDKERILKPYVHWSTAFFRRAVANPEGTEERINTKGVKVLTTYKHLQSKNWVLGANYPLKEAYEPIKKAKIYTAMAVGFGVILSILIVFLSMQYLTKPLQRLSNHIRKVPGAPGQSHHVEVTTQDEIGELGQAFNDLLSRLEKKQRALSEAVLKARNERARSDAIIAAIGDGLCMVDTDFRVLYQNKMHQCISGGTYTGSYCYESFEDSSAVCNGCPVVLAFADGMVHTTERTIERGGEKLCLEITASPLLDYEGKVVAGIEMVRNITERKRMEEAIERMAFHDALTGLPNRRLFNERLDHAIAFAQRNRQQLAVMFLDLDHFKEINDSLGHTIGDQLLQEVSVRLKKCIRRGEDTIARQGGDEFLMLLSDVKDEEDSANLSGGLLDSLAEPFNLSGYELFVSASIGISIFPHDGIDGETLIRNADTAMYRAKQQGRNSYALYNSSMVEKRLQRSLLESSLQRAMNNDELVLHYQPRFSIDTGTIIGMEALVRWNHPEQGLLMPASFLPQAEDSGLMLLLGSWILRKACAQNKAWQDAGYPQVRVSVNYSVRQLHQRHFVEDLMQILNETGLEPQWLELELTEAVMLECMTESRQTLSRLRQLGVHISIDNFGTGYFSLKQLREFPIDALKVDLSFVADLASSETSQAIARSVIGLAGGLDLTVMAQGVENGEQLQLLHSFGCSQMQGLYLSRPLPADDATRLLAGKEKTLP